MSIHLSDTAVFTYAKFARGAGAVLFPSISDCSENRSTNWF
jgi:hypothetical protein